MSWRYLAAAAALLVQCSSSSSVLRSDDPLPAAWLQVALLVTGSDGSDEKFDRCVAAARERGIWIHEKAPIKVVLSLEPNGNRITIGRYGAPPLRDEARPQWSTKALCLNSLTMAAEVAGRNVVMRRADPPAGCVMRGAVEGRSTDTWTAASYQEAVGDAMLRAAQQSMNYLALDSVDKGSKIVQVSGRGYACETLPAAANPKSPEDEEF